MKRGSPWYKRDPIAFLDAVEGMGPELIGAYAYLIDLIYARNGLSPRDDAALAGRIGCSKRKVSALIDELIRRKKIIIRDGFMTCKHAEDHASSMRAKSEQGTSAGRASGESRRRSSKNKHLAEQTVHECDEQIKIKTKIKKEEPNGSLSSEPDDVQSAYDEFRVVARSQGWPVPQVLNAKRKSSLRARLRECGGLDGWRAALGKASASSHCNGGNARGWVCNLDFLLQQSSFAKIMEGNYDDRPSGGPGSGGPHNTLMAGFAEYANSEPSTGGRDPGASQSTDSTSNTSGDIGGGGDASEPVLRLITAGKRTT